jgi:hypothetical protein
MCYIKFLHGSAVSCKTAVGLSFVLWMQYTFKWGSVLFVCQKHNDKLLEHMCLMQWDKNATTIYKC